MSVVTFADAEPLVKAWLLQSAVAPLLTRPDTGKSIYLAMPVGAPKPALVASRVGGGPHPRGDLPHDIARMQFDAWGTTRAQASTIAYTLIGELDSLSRTSGFTAGNATLASATVLGLRWLPDPESDTPRYVVDALVTTVATS